jgi:hypothetical protein
VTLIAIREHCADTAGTNVRSYAVVGQITSGAAVDFGGAVGVQSGPATFVLELSSHLDAQRYVNVVTAGPGRYDVKGLAAGAGGAWWVCGEGVGDFTTPFGAFTGTTPRSEDVYVRVDAGLWTVGAQVRVAATGVRGHRVIDCTSDGAGGMLVAGMWNSVHMRGMVGLNYPPGGVYHHMVTHVDAAGVIQSVHATDGKTIAAGAAAIVNAVVVVPPCKVIIGGYTAGPGMQNLHAGGSGDGQLREVTTFAACGAFIRPSAACPFVNAVAAIAPSVITVRMLGIAAAQHGGYWVAFTGAGLANVAGATVDTSYRGGNQIAVVYYTAWHAVSATGRAFTVGTTTVTAGATYDAIVSDGAGGVWVVGETTNVLDCDVGGAAAQTAIGAADVFAVHYDAGNGLVACKLIGGVAGTDERAFGAGTGPMGASLWDSRRWP